MNHSLNKIRKASNRILITAGPTREPIDPVRFISNYSTGKMGYALAKVALTFTKEVFLISGPANLSVPQKVNFFKVNSALEMKNCVMSLFPRVDIVIMAAAVCDYRAEAVSGHKIKKGDDNELKLTLVKNPDILAELGRQKEKQVLVGFAAETEDLIENATLKLEKKNLDMIVANDLNQEGSGFKEDTNVATLIHRDGRIEQLDKMLKEELAEIIFKRIYDLIKV